MFSLLGAPGRCVLDKLDPKNGEALDSALRLGDNSGGLVGAFAIRSDRIHGPVDL